MAEKALSSGQKRFLRWVFLGFWGYFVLQSVFVFSFRWSEVPFPRYRNSYIWDENWASSPVLSTRLLSQWLALDKPDWFKRKILVIKIIYIIFVLIEILNSWIQDEKEKVVISSPDWGDFLWLLLRIWEKPTLSALFVFLLSSNILILNRNRQFSEDGAFSLFILSFHCLRSGLALQTGE